MPVSRFVIVTATPGMRAPLSSDTDPKIVPAVVWPYARVPNNSTTANALPQIAVLFACSIFPPLLLKEHFIRFDLSS
jgi:hypothetical protein